MRSRRASGTGTTRTRGSPPPEKSESGSFAPERALKIVVFPENAGPMIPSFMRGSISWPARSNGDTAPNGEEPPGTVEKDGRTAYVAARDGRAMDCLNPRMLSDLEAGRLDASVEAEARAHVSGCERCRKELEPAPEKKAVEAVPASLPVGTKLPLSVACTFCKGALERREAVYCASCLAPHHADCWKTHGCCATCSHRSFVRAEKTLETTDEGAARTRTARLLALALGCLAAAAAVAVLSRSEPQSDRVASPEPLPVSPGTVTAPTAEPSRAVPTPEETRPRATTEPPPVPTPAPAATSEPTPRPRSVRPGGLRLVSTLGTYDWKP